MVINVPLNSSVAANLIFASRFVLNINYHQCPLIFSLILALRKVFILSKPYIKILWILNALAYRAKKMGYHCIPTLLTLNLIL